MLMLLYVFFFLASPDCLRRGLKLMLLVWEPLDYYGFENVPRASVDILLGTKWGSEILSDHRVATFAHSESNRVTFYIDGQI